MEAVHGADGDSFAHRDVQRPQPPAVLHQAQQGSGGRKGGEIRGDQKIGEIGGEEG